MRTLAELAPLRTAACRASADAVSAVAAGEPPADLKSRAHVERCLRCQAEVALYRRVLQTMATMREEPVAAVLAPGARDGGTALAAAEGVGLAPSGPAGALAPWTVRAMCVGSLTVSAGVLVWISRRRPLQRAG